MIQTDAIDLLIDVSGHTAGNRLSLFALRPAPVQASWLAYLDTTGLATMDYFLTDRFIVPEEDEGSYSEKVLRLPDMHLCLARDEMDVPVSPPSPDGPLTLGSFNNWAKVSDATIALWSRVLAELPGSRLMLRTGALNSQDVRRAAVARFEAQGISADRLILEGGAPRRALLASYNKVDIALDPFPYTGCTTTVEALWMGVPVVTLRGKRSVARASEGILTTAGLPHLVATDAESFVATVKGLAQDRAGLAALRRSLRAKVAESPLFDCARFARALEGLYREMWTDWCRSGRG
ncbi:MAG: hypothetical protein JOY81_00220 [Alphaproteobacteria bacterium]|nr:hypothetical protein [Alphaproteobacteria bacterium]